MQTQASTLPLSDCPNLGPVSAALLAGVGVHTLEQLRQLGSVAVYARLKRSGVRMSLNLLWAMEGVLTGVHWQVVAREHRASLLLALEVELSPA